MGHYIRTTAGDTVELTYNNILKDGTITVTAYVYDGSTQVTTASLTHVANGFYRTAYTIPGGYSKLTIFYLPSGTDNATDIDYIQIGLTSEGAGSFAGAIGGGLDDRDLENIKKLLLPELLKALLEAWKKSIDKLDKKSSLVNDLLQKSKQDILSALDNLKGVINQIVVNNRQEIPDYKKELMSLSQSIAVLPKSFPDIRQDVLSRIEELKNQITGIIIPEIPHYETQLQEIQQTLEENSLSDLDLSGNPLQINLSDAKLVFQPNKQDNTETVKNFMAEQKDIILQEMTEMFSKVMSMPDQSLERLRILGEMITRLELNVKNEFNTQIKNLDQVEVQRVQFLMQRLIDQFRKALEALLKKMDNIDEIKQMIPLLLQRSFDRVI